MLFFFWWSVLLNSNAINIFLVLLGFLALLQQVLSNVCIRFEPYLIKTKNIAHHIPHQTFQVNDRFKESLTRDVKLRKQSAENPNKTKKSFNRFNFDVIVNVKKTITYSWVFWGKESLLSLIRRRLTFKSREHKIAFGLLNFLKEKRLLFQKSKENKKQGLHFKKRERFFHNHSIY